jgi:hypothetical protein
MQATQGPTAKIQVCAQKGAGSEFWLAQNFKEKFEPAMQGKHGSRDGASGVPCAGRG